MDQPVAPGRIAWQPATVARILAQTPTVKSFFVKPERWTSFVAGQHVDVRLTAPDGYQAQRSYSIGSAPGAPEVELVIERLDTGEVSPFFHDVVAAGDTIELRGPIGGHFTWREQDGGPLLLMGGGSGVVPLVSIARHRATVAAEVPTVLVYSARQMADVIFRDELVARAAGDRGLTLVVTITREQPSDRRFRGGRIDRDLVGEVLAGLGTKPRHTYVCGANAFVDVASRLLLDMGVPFASIRTERYGGDPARETGGTAVPEA
ncbi:MAG: FAD-binding oxidoreductase [Bauldia sp.]